MERMKKWMMVLIGLFVGVVFLAYFFVAGMKFEKFDYVRMVDGDTFWVRSLRDGSEWKVRLWGVDAPNEGECYFDEATSALELMVSTSKLALVRHGYDGFGRILAEVWVNGKNLEESLIATGAAKVYEATEVHDKLKPSAEYVQALKVVEEKAKGEGLGMWSGDCL